MSTGEGPPNEACLRCQRTQETCIRNVAGDDPFRSGSSAQFHEAFAADQVWVSTRTGRQRELRYIDETDIIAADYLDLSDDGQNTRHAGKSPISHKNASKSTEHDAVLITQSFSPLIDLAKSDDTAGKDKMVSSLRTTFRNAQTSTHHHDPDWSDRALSDDADISNSPGEVDYTIISNASSPWADNHRGDSYFDHHFSGQGSASRSSHNDAFYQSSRSTSTFNSRTCQSRHQTNRTLFELDTVKPLTTTNVNDAQDRLHATLLRYFSQEFTTWFDLCDPSQHFAQVVPQRARSSRLLLNAVLTLAARHLVRRSERMPNLASLSRWKARIKPELREETAVHYHNECIRDLLRSSLNPQELRNEDLLAAAIILRTDEEMIHGTEEAGKDQQIFLHVINAFLNAQTPSTLASSEDHQDMNSLSHVYASNEVAFHIPADQMPTREDLRYLQQLSGWIDDGDNYMVAGPTTTHIPRSSGFEGGLRQACFWIAFRQEIYASFIKQRPITFPLTRCAAYRRFSAAEDAVWANRLIILCADVLEYCHGSINGDGTRLGPSSSVDRWQELKEIDRRLTSALPASFEPTFFAEPDEGEVLPEIWYLEPWHATGIMHIELARILLAVWDPVRPKFGPGHLAATRQLGAKLRNIVLRLCGIAQGNQQSPPNFVNAFMGISIGGEYFDEPLEQQALVDVLNKIEDEYAYSTGTVLESLKNAWGWEQDA